MLDYSLENIDTYELNAKARKIIDELDNYGIAAEHYGGLMIGIFYKRYGEINTMNAFIRSACVSEIVEAVKAMEDK